MKIALSIWNDRIAPLFESSRILWIPVLQEQNSENPEYLSLPEGSPEEKLLFLEAEGIEVLVCGGISKGVCRFARERNIKVFPFVAGDREEVLQAYLNGGLITPRFSMPGCSCAGRRGWSCNNLKTIGEES